jgi:phenylacetate-CoA ligase
VTLSSLYPAIDRASRQTLEECQLIRLKHQLKYVYARSSFYRRWFDQAGFDPEDVKSLADIRRLPLLTKSDLLHDQTTHPPYGQRLCVPEDKINMLILTSGTSGIGQEAYAMTRMDIEFGGSAWANWYYRCGLRRGDQILLTWPLGTNSGPQGAFLGAYKLGADVLVIAPYDSRSKVQTYMLKFNPAGMVVTPAYLSHLTVLCEEMGIRPSEQFSSLKALMIATEAYPISWAQRMEDLWGARLYELYGNTQQGGLAAGCCEAGAVTGDGGRGHLHFDEWNCLYEVINRETGDLVEPGEEGELVLTNLFREGSPLVRFRTNDRVRFLPYTTCTCGRPTNTIEAGSIARFDDMMKVRAQNVWPEAIDAIIFLHSEIEEYQGRVYVDERGRERMDVKIEFKPAMLSEETKSRLLNDLASELRRGTGVSMDLSEAPNGSLERFVFKTRRWTDERKQGLERVLHTASTARKE